MVKEAKNIDFYTTGRQPSNQDFERISEWIRKNRKRTTTKKTTQKQIDLPNNALPKG
ncbi:MAG: hypothetical protein ABJB11_05530 [Ferruginibacter sp.]